MSLCETELSQEQALAEQTHKASRSFCHLSPAFCEGALLWPNMQIEPQVVKRSMNTHTLTAAFSPEGKDERCWPVCGKVWLCDMAQASPAHRHWGGEGRTETSKTEQPFSHSMGLDSDLRNVLFVTRSESNLLVCTYSQEPCACVLPVETSLCPMRMAQATVPYG